MSERGPDAFELKDGFAKVVFLQRLILEARNHEGYLRMKWKQYDLSSLFSAVGFYDKSLAMRCWKSICELGLAQRMETGEHKGEIFVPWTLKYIGVGNHESERVKSYQDKKKEETPSGFTKNLQNITPPPLNPPSLEPRDIEKTAAKAAEEKEAVRLDEFAERLMNKHPRPSDKAKVVAALKAIKASDVEMEALVDAQFRMARSSDWRKEGGRFVPKLETWIAKRPWTKDEIERSEDWIRDHRRSDEIRKQREEMENGTSACQEQITLIPKPKPMMSASGGSKR